MDNNQMFNNNNQQPEVYAPMDAQQPTEPAPQFNAAPQFNEAPQYNASAQYDAPQYDMQSAQYTAPQFEMSQPEEEENNGGIGFSITGMILGILSVISCYCCGGILGIPGLILSIIALRKKANGKGMAIAGLITSCVGLLGLLIYAIAFATGLASESLYYYY